MTLAPGSDFEIELRPTETPLPDEQRVRQMADPGFGRYFTDNMVTISWSAERGWHDAQLHPYRPLELDPAVMTLHYGQAIFAGRKAYRRVDDSLALFRPWENASRFQRSAARMAMPPLPETAFMGSIEALVKQDQAWVPQNREQALYLRPFMIATDVGLGVRPSSTYLYMLIASPAGAYFPRGLAPVSVWLSEEYTRAAPGGTGEAKCAGNYAASLVAQAQAAEQDCDQVVWLDAVEHRWAEEMGGMNLYFVYGSGPNAKLVTPSLTGTLLPGVTRDSLLTLAKDLGYSVEQGRISTDEWQAGNANGTITEVFACGTAAVITPVAQVKRLGAEWMIGDGEIGPVSRRLRDALLDIQHGEAPDSHGWVHQIT